jgi:hypothetical protein
MRDSVSSHQRARPAVIAKNIVAVLLLCRGQVPTCLSVHARVGCTPVYVHLTVVSAIAQAAHALDAVKIVRGGLHHGGVVT